MNNSYGSQNIIGVPKIINYDGLLYSGSPDFLGKKLTVKEQKELLFGLANECRDCYFPTFADEQKYLPSTVVAETKEEEKVGATIQELTTPPQKKEFPWKDALLAGVGFFLIYKLLS